MSLVAVIFMILSLTVIKSLLVADAANANVGVSIANSVASVPATATSASPTAIPDNDKVVPVTIGAPFNKDSKPMEFEGKPAIKPHLAAKNSQTATFTEQDVVNFVKDHPRGGVVTNSTTHPTVKNIVFGNSKDLKTSGYIYSKLPYADDRLLCYVELEGNFQGTLRTAPDAIQVTKTLMMLVDAQTGNIIMSN